MSQALTQYQCQSLVSLLPAMNPYQAHLMRVVVEWDDAPASLGGGDYGPIEQTVRSAPLWKVWLDPDLYVYGEREIEEPDTASIRNLAESFDRNAVRDRNNFIRRGFVEPLIVVRRPNPENHFQDLMLLRKILPWRAAQELGWENVPMLIIDEMSDYDIVNVGLHLRMLESPPLREEVFRAVWNLERLHAEHRCSPDSPPPPSQAGIGKTLGCERSYVSKLESVWRASPAAIRLVNEGKLPIRVAIKAVEALRATPDALTEAIHHIVQEKLGGEHADAYIASRVQHLREQDSILRLVTGPSRPTPSPLVAIPQALQLITDRLTTYQSDSHIALGDNYTWFCESIQRLLAIASDVFEP